MVLGLLLGMLAARCSRHLGSWSMACSAVAALMVRERTHTRQPRWCTGMSMCWVCCWHSYTCSTFVVRAHHMQHLWASLRLWYNLCLPATLNHTTVVAHQICCSCVFDCGRWPGGKEAGDEVSDDDDDDEDDDDEQEEDRGDLGESQQPCTETVVHSAVCLYCTWVFLRICVCVWNYFVSRRCVDALCSPSHMFVPLTVTVGEAVPLMRLCHLTSDTQPHAPHRP